MAELEVRDELLEFLSSGIYRLEKTSNVIFVDPVRLLNCSYTRFTVSPSMYYSRFFDSKTEEEDARVSANSRKRKRKERKAYCLNERECSADQRHQEARPFLLRAHEALLGDKALLSSLCLLNNGGCSSIEAKDTSFRVVKDAEQSLIQLGSVWQAPLYEITLHFRPLCERNEDPGSAALQCDKQEVVSLFNNLVINAMSNDVEAEILESFFILPRESCFYMLIKIMDSIL